MKDQLIISFGQQFETLRLVLRQESAWPSPSLGFALHVFKRGEEAVPFSTDLISVSSEERRRIDQAPVLAAIGYAIGSEALMPNHALRTVWANGLDRLSARNPFPLDRESFAYRPIELFGIALGATHCDGVNTSSKQWLTDVVVKAEEKLSEGDFWQRLLSGCAAFLLGRHWKRVSAPAPEDMSAEELSLLIWLRASYMEYVTEQQLPATGLESALVARTTMNLVRTEDPAPAAVLLFSLGKSVELLIGTKMNEADQSSLMPQTDKAPESLRGKVDFAIITVREDEHKAVLNRFPKDYIFRGQHRSYSVGRLPLPSGESYSVAVVKSIEQGEASGQDVARDIIEDLDPQWILLVGIAGGIAADEFTLGDVVAAIRLHDFSVKALIEGKPVQYASTGGPAEKVVQDRLAMLGAMEQELKDWNSQGSIGLPRPPVDLKSSNFYGDEVWKKRVKSVFRKHFASGAQARQPLVTTGSIATSDSLIKDSQIVQQWEESARQTIAVEMELGGVYQASRRTEKTYPVLAIRGISDIVGFKRHPDWTAYACHSAAAFARAFLLTCPIKPRK